MSRVSYVGKLRCYCPSICYKDASLELFVSFYRAHPAIQDAAVIACPDEASQEVPRAYIVLQAATENTPSDTEIYNWVREQVAPHKRLDGGIAFVEAIPKSASGKILRRVLRDQLMEELGDM